MRKAAVPLLALSMALFAWWAIQRADELKSPSDSGSVAVGDRGDRENLSTESEDEAERLRESVGEPDRERLPTDEDANRESTTLWVQVLDSDQRPLADALVRSESWTRSGLQRADTRTSGDGRAVLRSDLGPFQEVYVEHGRHLPRMVRLDQGRGGSSSSDPLVVVLEPAVQILGRVLWDDGTPCVEAFLRARANQAQVATRSAIGPAEEVVSDESGAFTIGSLPPATPISLEIEHADLQGTEERLVRTPAFHEGQEPLRITIAHRAQLIVQFVGFEGEAASRLQSGNLILARRGEDEERRRLSPLLQTFENVPRGMASTLRLELGGEERTLQRFVPEGPVHRLFFEPKDLAPPEVPRTEPWSFSWTLCDPSGEPVTSERLLALGSAFPGRLEVVGSDGTLETDPLDLSSRVLREERQRVRLLPPVTATLFLGELSSVAADIEPGGEPVRFVIDLESLERGRGVVRFVGVRDGAVEPLGLVHLRDQDGKLWLGSQRSWSSVESDPSAVPEVEVHLPAGTYDFEAISPNGPSGLGQVTVVTGGDTRVEVRLGAGAGLRGRLVPPPGDRMAVVQVHARGQVAPPEAGFGGARPDAEGCFESSGLPAGEVEVTIALLDLPTRGLAILRESLTLPESSVVERDFFWTAARAGRTIRIEDRDEEAILLEILDVRGVLLYAGPCMTGGTLTLPEGEFTCFGAPPSNSATVKGYDLECRTEGVLEEEVASGIPTLHFAFPER